LPLHLKYEPHFDLDSDLDLIHEALCSEPEKIRANVLMFPTSRAYIVNENLEPVAIFDGLGPAFGGLLKLVLAMTPEHIDNPENYADIEVMNKLRPAVNSPDFIKPYILAVFIADSVCFHLHISTDLMIVLCERLRDLDIVNRDLWEYLYDSGIE